MNTAPDCHEVSCHRGRRACSGPRSWAAIGSEWTARLPRALRPGQNEQDDGRRRIGGFELAYIYGRGGPGRRAVRGIPRHRGDAVRRSPSARSGVGTLHHFDDLASGPDNHRRNDPGGHARSHRQEFGGKRCSVRELINRCKRSDHGSHAVQDCRCLKHSLHMRGHVRSAFCFRWGFRTQDERSSGSVSRGFGHESSIDTAPAARATKKGAAGKDLYRFMCIEGHSRSPGPGRSELHGRRHAEQAHIRPLWGRCEAREASILSGSCGREAGAIGALACRFWITVSRRRAKGERRPGGWGLRSSCWGRRPKPIKKNRLSRNGRIDQCQRRVEVRLIYIE
jgi:hypothetical protein